VKRFAPFLTGKEKLTQSCVAKRGEVKGTGLVQPEEEKAARGPYKCLQIS